MLIEIKYVLAESDWLIFSVVLRVIRWPNMKTYFIVNSIIKTLAIAFVLASPVVSIADALFKVSPSPVYQAIKSILLKDTLAQVSQRSGIVFKINTAIGNDDVHQSLAADSWSSAVKSLLSDYNYTLITEGAVVKTVIITGRAGSGSDPSHIVSSIEPAEYNAPVIIAPKIVSLPKQYNNFPLGSVMAVNLPVKEIMALGNGKTAKFDSPLGQFNVTQDNAVQEADGSKTWVGHLADEGQGYRILVSEGPAGVMGHVTTPEGTFNLESVNGQVFMVDTSKLNHVGYAGDTASTSMDAWQSNANAALTITQLKSALDVAKNKLDNANSMINYYNSLLSTYKTASDAAAAKLAPLTVTYNAALATYNSAIAKYNLSRTAANLAAVNSSNRALSAISAIYKPAYNLFIAYKSAYNSIKPSLVVKQAEAALALNNYNLALNAYNDASLAVVAPPVIVVPTNMVAKTGNTVVDVMVEYTTTQWTATYAQQRLAYLVTASNQSYIDSGIKLSLRLVYAEPTSYTNTDANSVALDNLAAGRGVFSGVAAKRVQYGADLVYLFRPLNAITQKTCGTTYVEMAAGQAANKWLGYGTISDGSSKDDMTNYYCAINTFTHEIGHSLGLVHDREYSSFTGAYAYSYAWGVAGNFGTIMSYKMPVIMYFSTPVLAAKNSSGTPQTCNGQPCGYPESDAARSSDQVKTVNLTAGIIAGFMPTMTANPLIK